MKIKYSNGVVQHCNSFASLLDVDIVELDCSKNKLHEIPESVADKLEHCIFFKASDNQLITLPENLRLPNCRFFDVSRNMLIKLPPNLYMPNINTFFIVNNYISALPESMTFEKCTEFNISFNCILRFPTSACFDKCRLFNINKNMFTGIPETMSFPSCTSFRIGNNPMSSIHENLKLKNCVEFVIYESPIHKLPDNLQLSKCTHFEIYNTKIKCLPESLQLNKCKIFHCASNKYLTSLGRSLALPKCEIMYVDDNNLNELPDNLDLSNCILLNARKNKLESLPRDMNLQICQIIHLEHNRLKTLPDSLMNCQYIKDINIEANVDLRLSLQFLQFIRRIKMNRNSPVWLPNDPQNVHNSNIQKCFSESIAKITARKDLPPFSRNSCLQLISENCYLDISILHSLRDYISDNTQHSILLFTYAEILWAVLFTINTDFDKDTQIQIYSCLNSEIKDSHDVCFTGRINRLVNCLNGFSPLVCINLPDTEFIPYLIKKVESELYTRTRTYSVQEHKKIVEKEMKERGYDTHVINTWTSCIE